MKSVYLETSFFGAYFDDRDDVASSAQRYWSRLWWDQVRREYELVISNAVVDELSDPANTDFGAVMNLIDGLRLIPVEEEVREIIGYYTLHQIMPRAPAGDAMHLALASWHKIDYLLTWNCAHIANPNKFSAIRMANNALGIFTPTLITPNQLLGDAQ